MKRSDYDVVSNIVNQLYNELKEIDKNQYYGKALKLKSKRLEFAYYYYESFRKNIRKLYMSKESKPMDRHKIAANVMCSLLKARIIKVNRNIPNLPLILLMANEYIAFCCALNIVDIYVRDEFGNNYSLGIPTTYIEEEEPKMSYVENTCKALFYTKRFRINDILAYANILFLLEKYTDTDTPEQKEKHNF